MIYLLVKIWLILCFCHLTTPTVKTVGFLGQAYRSRLP